MVNKIKNNIKNLKKIFLNEKKEYRFTIKYKIDKNLEQNILNLRKIFAKSSDIVFRKFKIGKKDRSNYFCVL